MKTLTKSINEKLMNSILNKTKTKVQDVFDYDYYASSSDFNSNQLRVIKRAFQDKLTREQIQLIAKPEFNADQMTELRSGLTDGVPTEHIELVADPKYSPEQMNELIYGFVQGLTREQVELYMDDRFTYQKMADIRYGLQRGVSINDMKRIAKPSINPVKLHDEIETLVK